MYPRLKENISKEELSDHFHFTSEERELISSKATDDQCLGFAVLLKCYGYLGYPPAKKEDIPSVIATYIANELEIDHQSFSKYSWKSRTFRRHLKDIRTFYHYELLTETNKEKIQRQLLTFLDDHGDTQAFERFAIGCFRQYFVELPGEKAFNQFLREVKKSHSETLYSTIYDCLSDTTLQQFKHFLEDSEKDNGFSFLKSSPRKIGFNTLKTELSKLDQLKDFDIPDDVLSRLPLQSLTKLSKRVHGEDRSLLNNHPEKIRYSLLACFLYITLREKSDSITSLFLKLMKRLARKAESELQSEVLSNFSSFYGAQGILKKMTFAILDNPEGTIQEIILSKVPLTRLEELGHWLQVKQKRATYKLAKLDHRNKKYRSNYRSVLMRFLSSFRFQSNSPAQESLLEGIRIVLAYKNSPITHYPHHLTLPLDLMTETYRDLATQKDKQGREVINKHLFELCVLERLDKALRCKEVWIEHSFRYNNPDSDLPDNWEALRDAYYQRFNLPHDPHVFVSQLKESMFHHLESFNEHIQSKEDVYVYTPGTGEKGCFRVPPIKAREERPVLKDIKEAIKSKWGMLDLLDMLVEANRQVDFVQYFSSSGQREILTPSQQRERLLLILFSLGTNMGLMRTYAAAKPSCRYDDLRYYHRRYMSIEGLRQSNIALANLILSIRNPLIWGECTSVASDGKQFSSYDQNLLADANPHYPNKGVMAYWHVDKNAACIHSQLKDCNSSEVYAMITGLVRHATEMSIESAYVDSRGQSEVAFAFCHMLGIDLLPRLKRIKHQRLHVPDKVCLTMFPDLEPVMAQEAVINWNIIVQNYDELVKYVAAISLKPEFTESILRRFSSYNESHPVYRAFIELGKAMKTIFLCRYLSDPELRVQINEGLNVVESWNSVNGFIHYGQKSAFVSNDPETQEMMLLSLQLLQNAVILSNTIMIDSVLQKNNIIEFMEDEDYRALTPLFTAHINPYGAFHLDFNKKSFLDAA